MKKRITSIALLAMFGLNSLWADNGQFDSYFTTLPTEVGKGVVTSLNYNGQWTAIKGVAGSTLGSTSWGKYNNPWGGNGRVWIKCVGDGEYVMAGQGRWLIGFDEENRSVTSGQGADEANALHFKITRDEFSETPKYHFQSLDGRYWYRLEMTGDQNAKNTLYQTPTTDDEGNPVADEYAWEIGTWQGVGFVRLDVKTWNDDPTGTNITKCDDGYYYSTMCYPYDLQIPDGNNFADGTQVPSMQHGDKLVTAWALDGEGQDITVTELKPGDIVKGGSCLMVRSTNGNVDMLIAPNSDYIANPSDESLFTGYYCEAPLDENFYMSIQDGYPKFERGTIKDDVNFPDDPAASRQVAANLGYITSNRSNRAYIEYRFDFENMTLQGYEHKDYATIAKTKFSNWLKEENMGGPFQIDPAKVDELQALLDAFVGDKSEEEYNELAKQFLANVIRPEQAFTAIKNAGGQYMGDRTQLDQMGLHANFNTPNGANGRAYLKKVDDTHYQVGFNGLYIQAPANGEQATQGETGVDFELIVTEPGKFAFLKDGVALSKASNGQLYGATVSANEETGEYEFGNSVLWTVDTNFSDLVRADAKTEYDGLYYGTVCVPYAVEANTDLDADAILYTVMYNDNDDLEMIEVAQLEAGQPGIISGSANTVPLTILGGYVSKAIVPTGDYALNGVLSILPEDGEYQNPHILGTITTTEIVGEDEEAQYVATTKLGLVMGAYDVNQAFWEGGANSDDVELMLSVNWAREAERKLGGYLADSNVGGAFQIPADKVEGFRQQIAQVSSEAAFNALKNEMTASVLKPETLYGALKNAQYMGERNQSGYEPGLYTNFYTPNGANGRAYMKKVDDTHYQLGFNGRFVQAPEAGVMVGIDTTPVDFTVTVVEPGKITLSKEGIYLVANNTLQGGSNGDAAQWTVDNSYNNIIRHDAKYLAGDLYFGAITMPYTVAADRAADPAASLYTVAYNGETLEMTRVDELPAGTPGLVAGASVTVQLQITGTDYVGAPNENAALKGILGVNPGDYDYTNPLFLNVNNDGELVMDYNNWYDINQVFFDAPAGVNEVKFINVPTLADGISDVKANAAKTGAIYNLSGQKVDKNFRGIVIVDGKKVIRK